MNNKQEVSNESFLSGLLIFYGIVLAAGFCVAGINKINKIREKKKPSIKAERLSREYSNKTYAPWPLYLKKNGVDVYVAGDPDFEDRWDGVAGQFYSFRDVLVYWQKVIKAVDSFSKINPATCIDEVQRFEKELISLFGNIVTTTQDKLNVPYLEKNCKKHTVMWPNDNWYTGPKPSRAWSNTYIDQIHDLNLRLCKSLTVIKSKIQSVETESNPTNHHISYLNMAVVILGWLDYYETDEFWYCAQHLLDNTYVTDNPALSSNESLRSLSAPTAVVERIEYVKSHVDKFGITAENKALFADSFEKVGYPFTKEGINRALNDAQAKLDELRMSL